LFDIDKAKEKAGLFFLKWSPYNAVISLVLEDRKRHRLPVDERGEFQQINGQ